MSERRGAGSALRRVLALAVSVLVTESAGAADCFAPLAANDKWACTVELSTGALVPYCLNVTATSGEGPERTFDMVTSGPYPRVCTCGAKGKGARARFNAANTYLCFDASTDTAESGTITKKRLVGQVYNVSVNVRGTFSCAPDPACVVQP
jgi:hypothetical protein